MNDTIRRTRHKYNITLPIPPSSWPGWERRGMLPTHHCCHLEVEMKEWSKELVNSVVRCNEFAENWEEMKMLVCETPWLSWSDCHQRENEESNQVQQTNVLIQVPYTAAKDMNELKNTPTHQHTNTMNKLKQCNPRRIQRRTDAPMKPHIYE